MHLCLVKLSLIWQCMKMRIFHHTVCLKNVPLSFLKTYMKNHPGHFNNFLYATSWGNLTQNINVSTAPACTHCRHITLGSAKKAFFNNIQHRDSPFYRPFSRRTWVSRCLLKQRMMEVVVTTGAISRAKLQSNHHPQQTNIQFFYRPDALPVAKPTVSQHWGENITSHRLASSKLAWRSSNFGLWPLINHGCHGTYSTQTQHDPKISSSFPNSNLINYLLYIGLR